jgi:hypothetical protein
MKHTFHYGNIFDGEEIRDAIELEKTVGIPDGSPQDPLTVGELIAPKTGAIEDYLKEKISFTLLDYTKGYQYFDVFVDKNTQRVAETKYTQNISLPKSIWGNWQQYQQRKSDLISNSEEIKEENTQGHWISEDPELSSAENFFLQEVPRNLDQIVEVLKKSSLEDQRIAAAYLIQWQDNKEYAAGILLEVLKDDPNEGVHNEAARALMALSNKAVFPKDKLKHIYGLIFNSSSAAINKGLALIKLLVEKKLMDLNDDGRLLNRIKQLSAVKQPAISYHAEEILKLIVT